MIKGYYYILLLLLLIINDLGLTITTRQISSVQSGFQTSVWIDVRI